MRPWKARHQRAKVIQRAKDQTQDSVVTYQMSWASESSIGKENIFEQKNPTEIHIKM